MNNIEKRVAELNLKELQEKGAIYVANPEAIAAKILKHTGIEVIVDNGIIKLK